jgi:two-component system sensor histidine kinase PilS (NtrC family)
MVSHSMTPGRVVIDVVDDGPGVPPDLRAPLFEPFFTSDPQGTGLGLYIARELAVANDATLDYVELAPGGQFRLIAREASSP